MNYPEKVKDDIDFLGWAFVPVFSEGDGPSFVYTVGLTETYGHAELILFGLPLKAARSLITNAVKRIGDGGVLKTSLRNPTIAQGVDMVFINLERHEFEEYMPLAKDYYKEEPFTVIQMIWPDPNNNFPWDKDYDSEYDYAQKILGNVNISLYESK